MPTLDWHLRRRDGVTLVELLVTSDADCEIRIESTLEPVWPPRRQGVPEAGWEDGTFVGRIGAGERLLLGYATPAEPDEPPAELQSTSAGDPPSVSARELIRALGDPTPPRDAVPAGEATHRGQTDSAGWPPTGSPVGGGEPTTGHDPATVAEQLAADRECLERFATGQRELAGRLDTPDVPGGTREDLG